MIDISSWGDGADVLRLSTVGLLVEGGIVWCEDGGDGNDVIDARLDFLPNSRGMVDVEVMDIAGGDDMTLSISGMGDPGLLAARAWWTAASRPVQSLSRFAADRDEPSGVCPMFISQLSPLPFCRSFFEHFELRPGS